MEALKAEADGLGKALDAASVLTPRSEAAYSRINQEFDNLVAKQSAPSQDQVRGEHTRRAVWDGGKARVVGRVAGNAVRSRRATCSPWPLHVSGLPLFAARTHAAGQGG